MQQQGEPKMHLWYLAIAHFQLLFGGSSKKVQDEAKKEGPSNVPGDQPDAGKPTEGEAGGVASEQHEKTLPDGNPPDEKPGGLKHRHIVKREQQLDGAKPASPSPSQLEAATDQAELRDEVKFEKQVAMALLTFCAGTVITAKGTTFGRPQATGVQTTHPQPFLFWASLALWFTSLLISMYMILMTTFIERSPGLLFYAKRINYFSLCITVVGVGLWIFS